MLYFELSIKQNAMKNAPRKQYNNDELKAMLEAENLKVGIHVYSDRKKTLIEMLRMRGVYNG